MPTTYKRGEVYFLSHGGPPTMFDSKSEPYKAWESYGKMVNAAKPRGLVVISAHWENEGGGSAVKVNVDESNPLIYDFYGFPKHFYEQKFESRGDAGLLGSIESALKSGGVEYEKEKRGLDHGVWVPFKVAFEGTSQFPIVQVSLPGDGSPVSSAKLGKALAQLRDEGYAIMGTGQVVHNLGDLFSGRPMPYTKPYLEAVQEAVHSPPSHVVESTLNLFRHPMFKKAHPTPEHLLPLAVAVAAAGESQVEDIFVGIDDLAGPRGGLGWGMWRWK